MADRALASGTTPDVLNHLHALGQSIWLDTISRPLLDSGKLESLVAIGLGGVTSNPSIFEKAIGAGTDYPEIPSLLSAGHDAEVVLEAVAVADIRRAADVLRSTYDARGRADGFVSLEVSPRLARDTSATIDAARRLWAAVDRPNLMVKIPATREGIPAIAMAIAEGINVNVTLLFAVERYLDAAHAYLDGLERLVADGGAVASVSSVASFFVSRVDTAVDAALGDAHVDLHGKAAIANARVAYGAWRELAASPRWRALSELGARPQRLLWASTSVKNPAYPSTYYVDALVGPDTVDTVPSPTLDAILTRTGDIARTIDASGAIDGARALLARLHEVGIDLPAITDRLEAEGVASFATAYDAILRAINAPHT
jgi:transaldolase